MLKFLDHKLFIDDVSVLEIAKQYGTPCYVYSYDYIAKQYQELTDAFANHPHSIFYAVKANSNLALLNCLAKLGAGFDIVSQGELERVLAAGGSPNKIVFSGVGKTIAEIHRALNVGIACFNIESTAELDRIDAIAAKLNKIAPISIRINPNVDAKTHPYIATGLKENKFGIDIAQTKELILKIINSPHLKLKGIACHIGSQILSIEPFVTALEHLIQLSEEIKKQGVILEHLDIGGGLGVRYDAEKPPSIQDYAQALLAKLEGLPYKLCLEPGRLLVANSGYLLTQIEYLKTTSAKNFAIVDAGMNDLIRPTLYHVWQKITPAYLHDTLPMIRYDIVGPVCETGDWLAKERDLAVKMGDILVIESCGAYSFSMSSNYNSRPRAAEVMIKNGKTHLIRARETYESLYANEFELS